MYWRDTAGGGDWYTEDDNGAPWCLTDIDDHLPLYFTHYAKEILQTL